MQTFLLQAIRNGARFHAPHDVIDIDTSRRGSTVTTADGIEILARHVVLCAGYEFPKMVPMGKNKIISTWAMATRPQPQSLWPQRALIWEASEPYLYLRSTFDGRVICGGEDEEFIDAERRDRYPRCYAALGYGGNGITFSMLAATLLSAQIAGKKTPGAALFAFQ